MNHIDTMAETAECVECDAEIPAWATQCPACGYQPALPASTRVASALLALLAAITGLITLASTAAVIAGDRSVATLSGVIVFGTVTVGAIWLTYKLRSRGPTRASDPVD